MDFIGISSEEPLSEIAPQTSKVIEFSWVGAIATVKRPLVSSHAKLRRCGHLVCKYNRRQDLFLNEISTGIKILKGISEFGSFSQLTYFFDKTVVSHRLQDLTSRALNRHHR